MNTSLLTRPGSATPRVRSDIEAQPQSTATHSGDIGMMRATELEELAIPEAITTPASANATVPTPPDQIPHHKDFKTAFDKTNGQVLLLAFGVGNQEFRAVEIPVYRPSHQWSMEQTFALYPKVTEINNLTCVRSEPEELDVADLRRDTLCESHVDIWNRIREAWLQQRPHWQQYLPLWRPTSITEVELKLYERKGSIYEVEVKSLDISKRRQDAHEESERIERIRRGDEEDFYEGPCDKCTGDFDMFGYWHPHPIDANCFLFFYSDPPATCFAQQQAENEKLLMGLDHLHHFLVCFKNPEKAKIRPTLRGYAQNSCIMDYNILHDQPLPAETENVHYLPPKVYGLYITDEFILTRHYVGGAISLLLTMVTVVVWKLATGDWSVAAGFGGVAVALITLTVMRSQQSDRKLGPLRKKKAVIKSD